LATLPDSPVVRSPGTPALRLGVVGCGRVAEQCHIPAALGSSAVELAAIADSDPQRLELVRGSFGVSCKTFTSITSLVGQVDAVIICLPNDLHVPAASQFLNAGIHVLCEKPLANTVPGARALCELAEARDLLLAVGYIKRFEPNF